MIERLEKNVGRANVTARVMDGQRLEIEDGSFDRVLCNFGVIFFPDRVKGFAEMHRVLRPGGRAVVSAWSTLARFEAFALFMSAVQKAAPDLPRPAQPPAALSLADPGRLEAEMREGGFEEVRVESIVGYIEAPSAEVLWARGETLSPPIVAVLQRIGPEAAARARENVIGALRSRFGDGVVKLACEAHYGIGVRS
jgi:SAM-dependent methyltransferase